MRKATPMFVLLAIASALIAGAALFGAQKPNTVTVPVVFFDSNFFAQNVPADAVSVTEDGKPVKITDLLFDGSEPLDVVIMTEYSLHLPQSLRWDGFYHPWQEILVEGGVTAYQIITRLREGDRAAFVTYGQQTHIEQDFTRNYQDIVDKIERLVNNPVGPTDHDVATYQAIVNIVGKISGKANGRKIAVVVIGTGMDTFVGATVGVAVQAARASGVQVFFVQVGWSLVQQAERDDMDYELRYGRHIDPLARSGPEMLFRQAYFMTGGIASASGGTSFEQRFIGSGSDIAENIVLWARSTHRLSYEAPEIKPDGKLHKIKVQVNRKFKTFEGKEVKLHAATVDGRSVPKERKPK